jgi:DMSO/TMAO reductase YedYZ molybdopterin-dependent catalytic subunit
VNLSVRAGLSGVAAAAAALGVAEVVAFATGPLSAPLLAVGGVVVNNVPAPIKNFGVAVFGVHDKTALITGTGILLCVYAGLLGLLALRSWRIALGGIGLFAAVGVAAAVTRHDAGVLAALPTLVGAAIAVPVLRYLLDLATATDAVPMRTPVPAGAVRRESADWSRPASGGTAVAEPGAPAPGGEAEPPPPPGGGAKPPQRPGGGDAVGGPEPAYGRDSRRRFLKGLGIVAAIAAVSGIGGRLLTSRRAVSAARNDVMLPTPVATAPPPPANAQVPGAVSYVTSNDDFYRIDTSLYPPEVDPATWQLRIFGMVRNPITITWEQLLKRPMIQRYITLACVSNEVGGDLISNALWLGAPIKALLDEAQPLPGADQVIQRSVDGWTCGSPTAALTDGRDAMLAVGMNGQPLPVEHGFPVRMVVPGLYGYVSACKWITEIELSRFEDFDAYWVPRGWSQQAPIKTESRIDTPRDGSKRKAGTVVVAGVAWAQHRGVKKVEVQVDGGPWAEATLAGTVSSDTWREWSFPWQAAKGKHAVRVRATDITGETQTSTPAPPEPNGATGWHSIQVTVD